MSQNRSIESRIKKAMNSLEEIQPATAPAFFYTRLEARMEAELLNPQTPLGWFTNIKFSLIALSLLLIVNFSSLFFLNENSIENQNTIDLINSDYFSFDEEYQYLKVYWNDEE